MALPHVSVAIVATLTTLALSSGAIAQKATFTTFGAGCGGTATKACVANNANATALNKVVSSLNPMIAIQIKATTPLVLGFELFTQSPTRRAFKAYIYLPDASGAPSANPLATTTITTDQKLAWYRARFAKPVLIGKAASYFISWEPGAGLNKNCVDPKALTGTTWPHMHRTFFMGKFSWFGPFNTERWAFKVLCAGSVASPRLAATGIPSLGNKTFAINLTNAKAKATVLLALGGSNTKWNGAPLPIDMNPMGAPGCSLLVSLDLMLYLTCDANGSAKLGLPIPNNVKLKGRSFHCQFGILDSTANQMGMVMSNGGSGMVGTAQ